MGDNAFPAPGILHGKRAGSGQDIRKQLLLHLDSRLVIGFVELEKAGVLKGAPPDHIAALRVDDGKGFTLVLFLGKNPLLLQVGRRNDAQEIGLPLLSVFRVPHCDPVAESQGLFPVYRIRIGPGYVDRRAEIGNPGAVSEQLHPRIGNVIIILGIRPRTC